jgi:demethylspheroidene O-methyltransferase
LAAPDLWVLGQRGAALSSNQGALAMIEHHKIFYDDLADPIALLKGGRGNSKLARFWTYAPAAGRGEPASADRESWQGDETSAVAPYSALMAASQPMVAEQVIDAYPRQGFKTFFADKIRTEARAQPHSATADLCRWGQFTWRITHSPFTE